MHIMHDKPLRGAWNLDVWHFQRRQFGAAFVPNREGSKQSKNLIALIERL